ncbi:unnamed protein product [Symbiodinium sp. CCMP2592]|nr:unnamed protein product [Symbiodinium sp. CCMP2592]
MALAPASSPASPRAEEAAVIEVKDEEAEDREELPTIKTPAMASILGECLTEVLQDMGASVSSEEEELLLQNFHKAWFKEMSKLPRMWEVDVRGSLESFSFAGRNQFLEIGDAEVRAPDFSVTGVPVRIQCKLRKDATGSASRKRRVIESDDDE